MNLPSARILSLGVICAAVTGTLSIGAPEVPGKTVRDFKRLVLSDQFWCEGASFGDFNRDGINDIVAGPWWWEGPDWKTKHELYEAKATFRRKLGELTTVNIPGYEGGLGVKNTYSDNFFSYPYDFNGDGWMDVLVIGFPGKETAWFENPQGKDTHWTRHVVFSQTDNESPTFTDLTGDGKPELVCITKGAYGYASPDWSDPAKPWTWHQISPNRKYGNFTHGMGVGDVNGDGRADLLEKDGWWEQPASLEGDPEWKQHPFRFAGAGGAQMFAYDVNGDGLNDVITSLAAHGFGLAWYEQTKGGDFKMHSILGSQPEDNRYGVKFSEIHALDLVDMDGDGLKDIVTGKRFWSHGRAGDPDRNDEAVIYWFGLKRGPDGVDWIPHRIDNDSGVGTQVVAGDINADGLPDVVVGNKKGIFVHLQQARPVTGEEWLAAQPKPLPAPKIANQIKPTADDGTPLNLDFEDGSLRDWKATGNAFDGMPAKGDAVARRRNDMRSGHRGEYWVGTYEAHGDEATGTLTSAPFTVTQPYASFLIGGGSTLGTRVEILNAASGLVLFQATGPDNEEMRSVFVDLRPFVGAKIRIRLVDEATTGWGHVNFDEFTFHDARPFPALEIKPASLAANLPSRVDLRPEFSMWGLTQRKQGSRGTCSVFATIESVEFAVAKATGRGQRLSVEFANWAANRSTGRQDDGDFFKNIIRGCTEFGICPDELMPYAKHFDPAMQPAEQILASAREIGEQTGLAFHWIQGWKPKPGLGDEHIWHIKSVIAAGWPVSAGSYHSIVFTGYEDDAALPGGGQFFVADSGGDERTLSYAAAKERMCDLFWTRATPKQTKVVGR